MAKYYRIFDAIKWTGLNLDEINGQIMVLGLSHLMAVQEGTSLRILDQRAVAIVADISPGDYLVFNAGAVRGMLGPHFLELYKPWPPADLPPSP